MVECVTDQTPHKKVREDEWVSYPFGLLIYYWVLYYYQIFDQPVFIPQKNGASPSLKKGRNIAFRQQFQDVIEFYKDKGGLSQFRYDLIHSSIPGPAQRKTILLLRKIQHTVKDMPMKHFGYSMYNEHYSLVNYNNHTIRTPSYFGLITEAGSFFIHPELHQLIEEVGSLIIGKDSIINGWADFTAKAAQRNEFTPSVSKEEVLSVLTKAVDIPRDITQVKSMLSSVETAEFECVWSGTSLKESFHIDHIIPYSLWQNNNLWNLIPVKSTINLSKSDRIPSPDLIHASAGRIKDVWKLYADRYERQFDQELFEGLGVQSEDDLDLAIHSLTQKSKYLIDKRGFQKFEIN